MKSKLKDIGWRALKTFLQAIAGSWTAGALITDLSWKYILISAVSSALYSILMNVIPLIPCEEEGEYEIIERG